ncbi:MAG TPA: glycosyltransferase family 4 protein, partial [Candidatus Paceibacterota bacterium]
MKNKINILFVISSLNLGGAQRVLSEMANYWASKGHNVSIVSFSDENTFYLLNKNISLINNDLTKKYKNIFEAIKYSFSRINSIKCIIRTKQIHIIISFMAIANIESIIAAKISGIPVIISERSNPNEDPLPIVWKIARRILYNFADQMVLQTEQVKSYYKNYYTNKVTIKNPLRIINYQNVIKEDLILAVGRLEKEKGYDDLLTAFAQTYSNWNLEIIGEGNERKHLENLISDLNLNNKVRLIGAVKNVDSYFNRAQIFIMTSKYEGFPNSLCEAMAFKLASISYECPFGPSEIIKNGYNGILVEPGNV